jgi:general secretion pathway protein J
MIVEKSPGKSLGFTLLELLIALAVTGAVVALVFSAFGAIGKTDQRNSQSIERVNRQLSVAQLLKRKIDTLRLISKKDAQGLVLFFNGNAAGALWVAPLPERMAFGGLHILRFSTKRGPDGRVDLILEALPYDGYSNELRWEQAISETIIKNIKTLHWHYQDGKTGNWVEEWSSDRVQYPSRIRIELGDEKGSWPIMTFSLSRAR